MKEGETVECMQEREGERDIMSLAHSILRWFRWHLADGNISPFQMWSIKWMKKKKWAQKSSAMLNQQKSCHLNAIILICCVISWHYFMYVHCDAFKSQNKRAIKKRRREKNNQKTKPSAKSYLWQIKPNRKQTQTKFFFLLLEIWFKFENCEHHSQPASQSGGVEK